MLIFEKEEREGGTEIDLRRLGHGLPTLTRRPKARVERHGNEIEEEE